MFFQRSDFGGSRHTFEAEESPGSFSEPRVERGSDPHTSTEQTRARYHVLAPCLFIDAETEMMNLADHSLIHIQMKNTEGGRSVRQETTGT